MNLTGTGHARRRSGKCSVNTGPTSQLRWFKTCTHVWRISNQNSEFPNQIAAVKWVGFTGPSILCFDLPCITVAVNDADAY